MKSTFWMTAQEAEDEIKSREVNTRDRLAQAQAYHSFCVINEDGSCDLCATNTVQI